MKIKLSAYLPLLVPLKSHKRIVEWYSNTIKELKEANYLFVSIGGTKTNVKFAISNEATRWSEYKKLWEKPSSAREFHYLKISTQVEIFPQVFKVGTEEISKEEAIYWAKYDAAVDFKKFICDFVIATNLARPGSLHCKKGPIIVNAGHIHDVLEFDGQSFSHAVAYADEITWPTFLELSIKQVWEWFSKVKGLENGVLHGPSGRALTAVSYLLRENTALDLVWALLGLEALYSKSNVALTEQLIEKSKIFLGTPTSNKKLFGRMYDFRSRLLHGNIDFPIEYCEYDALDEVRNYSSESYDAALLAKAVLIATLQKMVQLDLYELNFKYALDS